MKILVRLPNWLGDMVMAAGVLNQLSHFYPGASVSFIVKKGLEDLLPFYPLHENMFVFSKTESPGVGGVWRFGRSIGRVSRYDLYLSFPDSFSSALMGYAAGAKQRIGFAKEGRFVLMTHTYHKPQKLHRAEEYLLLLEQHTRRAGLPLQVRLSHAFERKDYAVVNINSEASSRRLTTAKAIEIISALRQEITLPIRLIGAPAERPFVESVWQQLPTRDGIEMVAGQTSLGGLAEILASARVVLSTDSGPAHLANAMGTPTVVLFGAGNENNTSPYNKDLVRVMRLGKLSCEPCTKNTCIQFGEPQCLELLDSAHIISHVKQRLPRT